MKKRLLAFLLSMLMIVFQLPVMAADVEIDLGDLFDDVGTGADFEVGVSNVSGYPGEEISLVVALKSNLAINTIGISGIEYDEDILTFTGFSGYDELEDASLMCQFDDEKLTGVAAFSKAKEYYGRLCQVNFVINDDAPAGETTVSFNNMQFKNGSNAYDDYVVTGGVVEVFGDTDDGAEGGEGEGGEGSVTENNLLSISDAVASAGDSISLVVDLETKDAINTIGISALEYDEDVLTFTGFSDYDYLDGQSMLCQFDDVKCTGVAAFSSAKVFDGQLCVINFDVNDDAPAGKTIVSFGDVKLKNGSDVYDYSVISGTVTVKDSAPKTGSYVVKHYFETYDGSYILNDSFTERYSGLPAGNVVYAEIRNVEGYVFNSKLSETEGVIVADDVTVLELCYDFVDYSVSFYDTREEVFVNTITGNLGYVICESDIIEPEHEGYEFIGWTEYPFDETKVFPSSYFVGKKIEDLDGWGFFALYREVVVSYTNYLEINDATAKAGDTVSLEVYLEVENQINTIGFAELEYDEDILTFVGFSDYDYLEEISTLCKFDDDKMTAAAAFDPVTVFSGKVCSINFVVNDDAPAGETEVTINNIQLKNGSKAYDCSVDTGIVTVYEKPSAISTLEIGNDEGYQGDEIQLVVNLDSANEVNTIGLAGLEYDEDVLTFVGFSDYDYLEDISTLCRFDDEKMTVVAGLESLMKFNGQVCVLNFVINDDAPLGNTYVTFSDVQLKNGSNAYESSVVEGMVTVKAEPVVLSTLEIGDFTGYPGDEVQLVVNLDSANAINSIGLAALEYDEDVLTFVGFSDYDYLEDISTLCRFDDDKMAVVAGLESSIKFNGQVCVLNFVINEGAPVGNTYVTFNDVKLKNNSVEYGYEIDEGVISVEFKEVPVNGVSLSEDNITLDLGETYTLKANVFPVYATNKNVVWSTSDKSVVTVNNGFIKAVGMGTATITVKTVDGSYTDSCTVTVKSISTDVDAVYTFSDASGNPGDIVYVDVFFETEESFNTLGLAGITYDKDLLTYTGYTFDRSFSSKCILSNISEGSSIGLSFTAAASSTFNGYDGLIFTLEFVINEDAKIGEYTTISSVNSAVKFNHTEIASTTIDGLVTIAKPVTGVSLDESSLSLTKGDTVTLTATVTPSDAYDKSVTWKSSNTSVVTVKNGVITAVGGGTATVTVTTVDGGYTDSCVVTVNSPVTDVTLNKSNITLEKGSTEKLTAIVAPTDATNKNVTWKSSNSAVASVSSTGEVTAVGVGSAVITVTTKDGSYSAKCNVTVVISVTGISLDKTSLTLDKGKTETLTATITPSDATNKNVTWKSSDESVVTVADGVVTAVGKGSATVSVTTEDGKYSAECYVKVNVPVTSVTLDQKSLTLDKGETTKLVATVNPSDASNKAVTWTSTNTSVVTVVDGVVTAVGKGSAIVKVVTVDGNKVAACSVTVKIPVESVSLNKTSLDLVKGATETLKATVLPENANNKSVTWTSSDTSVATVSNSGLVTAVGGGKAEITVTTADRGLTATCYVNVTVPVTGVTLDKKVLTLDKGTSALLTATLNPSDATNKAVTWTSEDESVVKVTDGVVTAVGKGSTIVTVTTVDGGYTAECEIDVIVPVIGVSLDSDYLVIERGNTASLVATVNPDDASNPEITWSSSDEEVATVENGVITAIEEGKATITVKTADGGFEAKCNVTVVIPVESITLADALISLEVGEACEIVATVNPEDATNKYLTWTSSDKKIAEVSDGVVTANGVGLAIITATSADGRISAACAVRVNPADPEAYYTISDVTSRQGTDISVTISLETDEAFNTLGLAYVGFDENVLEYTGHEIDSDFKSIFTLCRFDEDKMLLAMSTSGEAIEGYEGEVITLNFRVKDDAPLGVSYITVVQSSVKLNTVEIVSSVTDGEVTIIDQLLGDIDLNDAVDMNDAILLLQHSMFPDLIKIGYKGNIDFTKDGAVDMNDAILLLQHSMFPDLIPLG